jgi:hypothetical protein
VTIGRTPRKVEEIVLDGNSLASLSTTKGPQIVYDRRPNSALIAELRTTQNAHFNSSRGGQVGASRTGDSSSLANCHVIAVFN